MQRKDKVVSIGNTEHRLPAGKGRNTEGRASLEPPSFHKPL